MDENTSSTIVLIISKIVVIFIGMVPMIPQYIDIRNSKDASGFSTWLCFLSILANTLRIVYWFGHYFDEALLIQSTVMILTMFIMMELCIRMDHLKAEAEGFPLQQKSLFDFRLEDFWQWTNLSSFIGVILLIAGFMGAIMYAFIRNPMVIEGIGYTALMTESILGMPQFFKNLRNRSVKGMNVMMVVLWFVGDAIKGYFCLKRNQPYPFLINAFIQISMDLGIFMEIAMFRE